MVKGRGNLNQCLALAAIVLAFGLCGRAFAQSMPSQYVRLAELQIDPAQLPNYQAALQKEIETSVRGEPGVLGLYAVSDQADPAHVRIFEIYADENSYRTHLETPHFREYKAATQKMVISLQLIETKPIVLSAKLR